MSDCGCCCEIFTCHAELIHAYAEIQQVDIPFVAADWRGLNFLRVIPLGAKGPNDIGPHFLPKRTYSVTVHKHLGGEVFKTVESVIYIDRSTGVITFWKTGITPAFSGRVEVR